MEKEQIHKAFMRLGELLRDRRVTGEVDVFGGAAIVMGFDLRRATQDEDSLIAKGHGEVMQAADEVERELRLPPNWLDEQATIYLSKHFDHDQWVSAAGTAWAVRALARAAGNQRRTSP